MIKQKTIFAICAAILIAGVFVPHQADAATKYPRRMDGLYVTKAKVNLWPVAVMIDNHTAARPQSGLQSASIVYESLAEGGIPRFMALFVGASSTSRIGPVRSTRPYFVNYASEYGAAVAHAGGSPDGLKAVKNLRLVSLFALKGSTAKLFYRALGGGVHGLYSNMKNLIAGMKAARVYKYQPKYRTYPRVDDATLAARGRNKSGVFIDFGYGKSYDVEYRYDKKINAYRRFTGGRVHKDRVTNRQIQVKNVVIINVPKERVLDRKGRLDIKVIGKGTGYLLQNGKAIKITWKKANAHAHTYIYLADKSEAKLVRGNTWFEIVPKGHKVKLL